MANFIFQDPPPLTHPSFLQPYSDVSGLDRVTLRLKGKENAIVGYFLWSPLENLMVRDFGYRPNVHPWRKPWFANWRVENDRLHLLFAKGILNNSVTKLDQYLPVKIDLNTNEAVPDYYKNFSGRAIFQIQQIPPEEYLDLFKSGDGLGLHFHKGKLMRVESGLEVTPSKDLPRNASQVEEMRRQILPAPLYFKDLSGGGKIQCRDCGNLEDVIGFSHGYDDSGPVCVQSYQCQNCGFFHDVEGRNPNGPAPPCFCRGVVTNRNAIFCPSCRSKNLRYRMEYIT